MRQKTALAEFGRPRRAGDLSPVTDFFALPCQKHPAGKPRLSRDELDGSRRQRTGKDINLYGAERIARAMGPTLEFVESAA